jgi:hypothetical protein
MGTTTWNQGVPLLKLLRWTAARIAGPHEIAKTADAAPIVIASRPRSGSPVAIHHTPVPKLMAKCMLAIEAITIPRLVVFQSVVQPKYRAIVRLKKTRIREVLGSDIGVLDWKIQNRVTGNKSHQSSSIRTASNETFPTSNSRS